MAETDNEKIIDLLYRLHFYPSIKKLIKIVQQSNPEITEAEIRKFL